MHASFKTCRAVASPLAGRDGATLFLLDGLFAVRAFVVADLLRREHSSANAATPARKCGLRDYRH